MKNVEKESKMLIERALALHATDIHFHPKESSTALMYRIHGKLYEMATLQQKEATRLIAHFKYRAGMDIGEERRPQDGSLQIETEKYPINLRFSTIPSLYHESLSVRLLPQQQRITLATLSFFPPLQHFFHSLIHQPGGIILLVGPTGSGKTTTLYAFMSEMAKHSRVISVEDPIEMRNDAFIQSEVNVTAKVTYEEMLRSALRHDPDVLMIGEIRDKATAHIAIRAALTGHLVCTTMHAISPFGALERLYDFGFSRNDLEETLLAIISQRLLPRICPFCYPSYCSPYCNHWNDRSRVPVFNILANEQLKAGLCKQKDKNKSYTYSSRDQLKKGMALGIFPPSVWKGAEEA
ncbi:competence type IV pilus ATPase ComGA [Aliibacillus thermotolerans]|uniref:Competence type IV pilus ATPase ComGA n=1 Tax=Aliibacillus thermotolerans TaxID=1834418 RepID=A0ABW0UB46_9BACI|nr:competence type IV pilus ATPase ComGA [Aliibacillus thermotolerans]MDA3131100.1 AAA family ATPase [Aliibacillus thermotolerans]